MKTNVICFYPLVEHFKKNIQQLHLRALHIYLPVHEIGLEYSGHEVRKWVGGDRERKGGGNKRWVSGVFGHLHGVKVRVMSGEMSGRR